MAIPDYQSLMLPLLKFISDGREHSSSEAIDHLADEFQLTSEEREALLQSGAQFTFANRVGWARTYLKKAGLLDSPRRGFFQISKEGLDLLATNPSEISNKTLEKYPSFIEFKNLKHSKEPSNTTDGARSDEDNDQTPEESLEASYQTIRINLASEILEKVKSCSPSFFERLVVEMLVKMGYGGSLQDAGKAVGKSGDGGIDGIIKEDRLGLDVIYIQAKKWEGVVGRPEIQKFAGALLGQQARKGIFITTSSFTGEARQYVKNINSTIILIDGEQLAEFMIDFNVGVSKVVNYELKRIDTDYFLED